MPELTVAAVMTKKVVAVDPGTPVKDVISTLARNAISAVPVLDEQLRPLGVVSEADALAKHEYHAGTDDPPPWYARRDRKAQWLKSKGNTAADIMTSPAVTVGEDEPLTVAARRMAEKRLRRVFVVDTMGRVVGVLSRRDVLGTFLRDDEDVRADIERQVLAKGMWLIPGTVTVKVHDGIATLYGTLEHRSTAEVARVLTGAVSGVVGVRSNLRYEIDDAVSTGL
ncbi:BON domain-containing protein [Actinokineospora alba]|uniref:BON domain-containing protein n=1 Tax=Actinokineospora alba TaxID=504798 RepID=A0A1H0FMH4_9PSEU|nr:CBS domain-containing protein [Actinokineospora alba]TDP69538.1 BON domain-containing protein [Actinokineospora alba]SDI14669.1 BON domain-containing protein [Actinokineospora alba]SDN95843.1 BON domain-containing protein [Actinokineospora alba]